MPTYSRQWTQATHPSLSLPAIALLALMLGNLLLDKPTTQAALAATGAAEPSPIATVPPAVATPFWTIWGAQLYDLADDGLRLWIGATGGVIRWEKSSQSYRRYTAVDGLPHTAVWTVAVDGAGNRWFGGDGGLSRLDPQEQWTHFTAANSGLYTNTVDAIALTNDGFLYLSHGLPNGSVSRFDPATHTWQWFPHRTTAVVSDYQRIRQARNNSRLWTVAGAEVWVDYLVYNGGYWQNRTPASALSRPLALAVDSHQQVWALKSDWEILQWQTNTWATIPNDIHSPFGFSCSTLTLDQQDHVWLGCTHGVFYGMDEVGVSQIDGSSTTLLERPGPVTKLLATEEGIWAIGPGWLLAPDGSIHSFQDAPLYPEVTDAIIADDGAVWFYSGYNAPYSAGAVYRYQDQQTLTLADDVWESIPGAGNERVDTFAKAPGGDIWYATYCQSRGATCLSLVQHHAGQQIRYQFPEMILPISLFGGITTDLYAQDDRHLWLGLLPLPLNYISLIMFDTGDPLTHTDDVKITYPLSNTLFSSFYINGARTSVSLNRNGTLWLSYANSLLRYNGTTWETVLEGELLCDLVAAADGTIFARIGPTSNSCGPSVAVLVIRPNGKLERQAQTAFVVANESARVRSTAKRNTLWTIGVDGAIWYRYVYGERHELWRQAEDGSRTTYPLPMAPDTVQRLEVDHLNRVWIVANNQLWRFASAAAVPLPTRTPTITPTPSATPTLTATHTPTPTLTSTATAIPTDASTSPLVSTATETPTATFQPTVMPVAEEIHQTLTPTATLTLTPTISAISTLTATATVTIAPSPTPQIGENAPPSAPSVYLPLIKKEP